MLKFIHYLGLFLFLSQCAASEQSDTHPNSRHNYTWHDNYEEIKNISPSRQPTLPNPLRRGDMTIAASEWEAQRQYLKKRLTYYQYGEMPDHRQYDSLRVETVDSAYLFGKTLPRTIIITANQESFRFTLNIPWERLPPGRGNIASLSIGWKTSPTLIPTKLLRPVTRGGDEAISMAQEDVLV